MNPVGIVAYPGAQEAAILGLADLLTKAGALAGVGAEPGLPGGWAERLPQESVGAAASRRFSALILPPSVTGTPDGSPALSADLKAHHRQGTLLCSVCAGALVLADTGLLDGRPATTHWLLADLFRTRHPKVLLDVDRLVIDDGDIVTGGGVMAWTNLGLRLIERLLGPEVMLETARLFLIDPAPSEQRSYTAFMPRLDHGDARILTVQHHLRATYAGQETLDQLACHAGYGTRTFLRKFETATGLSPTTYRQQLRIAAARLALERSSKPVQQISLEVGYQDTGAFGRIFQRLTGMSAGAYRKHFGRLER